MLRIDKRYIWNSCLSFCQTFLVSWSSDQDVRKPSSHSRHLSNIQSGLFRGLCLFTALEAAEQDTPGIVWYCSRWEKSLLLVWPMPEKSTFFLESSPKIFTLIYCVSHNNYRQFQGNLCFSQFWQKTDWKGSPPCWSKIPNLTKMLLFGSLKTMFYLSEYAINAIIIGLYGGNKFMGRWKTNKRISIEHDIIILDQQIRNVKDNYWSPLRQR